MSLVNIHFQSGYIYCRGRLDIQASLYNRKRIKVALRSTLTSPLNLERIAEGVAGSRSCIKVVYVHLVSDYSKESPRIHYQIKSVLNHLLCPDFCRKKGTNPDREQYHDHEDVVHHEATHVSLC